MTGESMPAVTLWEPWATLIAIGAKRFETRSWPPPKSLIGQRVAIHAAKRRPDVGLQLGPWRVVPHPDGGYAIEDGEQAHRLAHGAVVCTARIVRGIPMRASTDPPIGWRDDEPSFDPAPWIAVAEAPGHRSVYLHEAPLPHGSRGRYLTNEDPFGDYSPRRWAWELGEVQAFDPIPARGGQGVWRWMP